MTVLGAGAGPSLAAVGVEPGHSVAPFIGCFRVPFNQTHLPMRSRTTTASLLTLVLLCTLGLAASASAQDVEVVPGPETRPSPMAVAQTTLDDGTYVKVVYNQPHRRGREIFGGLVPYGQLWRTGANEATELTTTGDLKLGDATLPAGTYALFTVPGPETWTVVVNAGLGQWGAYNYDQSRDVVRFEVPVSMMPDQAYEAFTISFEVDGHLALRWDRTEVRIPLEAAGSM